jgi:negative regulator of sigma-B (phosphoserine phosphatase)
VPPRARHEARLDGTSATLSWVGVGNVEGRLLRAGGPGARPESLLCAPGIVGHRLGALAATDLPLRRGDVLILATDGVSARFADDLHPTGSCRAIAERVLERHGRPADDALVVVARYLGSAS